jgi:hypothetical protein
MSVDALGGVAHVPHADLRKLAAACQVVGLRVSTEDDVRDSRLRAHIAWATGHAGRAYGASSMR